MSQVAAVVLAAGSSMRFGEMKQFLELAPGVRLVDAAVDAALRVSYQVILVLPPGVQWDGREVASRVKGGATRLESVANALAVLSGDPMVVLIHDAAHPLARQNVFTEVIDAVISGADGAVPILPVSDVVKRRDEGGRISTVGRDGLGLAQVPMAFATEALLAAHARASYGSSAWEDAELVERNGGLVVSVPGSSRNVHIVTAEDLEIARSLASIEE